MENAGITQNYFLVGVGVQSISLQGVLTGKPQDLIGDGC